jgi:uncharacterized membrane protein/peroxiredoxin
MACDERREISKEDAEMSVIDAEIEVDVPLRAVYDQWTQFEEFPRFMEGVEQVRQVDDTTLHWAASIAGILREWDARITEQIPDHLIAWTSVEGTRNDGLVSFDAVAANRTKVSLRLDLEPEGPVETVGDALGVIGARARGDLARFKAFIEERRLPTGAWRGEVLDGDVVQDVSRAAQLGDHVGRSGEVPASTGGVVDLDRVLGTIPVLLVFVEPLVAPATEELVAALGEHLADFGRDRIQLLVVARVTPELAVAGTEGIAGNVRVLADPDSRLAARFGAEYRVGRPVTVLIGADGRLEATWVDRPGPGFVEDLRARVHQLSAR